MIASHFSPGNAPMNNLMAKVGSLYASHPGALHDGHTAALKQLFQLAYREAATLAYADAFRAIMVAFAFATLLAPFLRSVAAPAPSPGGGAGGH
jgi:MFS transporter, DHA2 family, multidrug resistance protein